MSSPASFDRYDTCQMCGKKGFYPEPLCGSCADTLVPPSHRLPVGLGHEDPYEAPPEVQEEFGVLAGILLRDDERHQFVVPNKVLENEHQARQKLIDQAKSEERPAPPFGGESEASKVWNKLGDEVGTTAQKVRRNVLWVTAICAFLIGLVAGTGLASILMLSIGAE